MRVNVVESEELWVRARAESSSYNDVGLTRQIWSENMKENIP